MDFETFSKLSDARLRGEGEFRKAFTTQLQTLPSDQKNTLEQLDFQMAQQDRLAADWWNRDPTALSIRHYFNDEVPNWLSRSGASMQGMIRAFLAIPIQFGIAILLSFLITVDVHRIRQAMDQLRDTRIQRYFDEIAPELAVFSRLLGKSLEAQLVIAALAAVATFLAMWWLGVDNKYFLALIVFISNLIPVVGVFIAALALSIAAVLQPDGSIWLGVQVVVATVVVHLLTISMISPRIVGRWFHLQPVLCL